MAEKPTEGFEERRPPVMLAWFHYPVARWTRDRTGSVTVEFALTAIPFFTLIIGLLELSFYFAFGTILEGATFNASRLIRTGQVQESADPEGTFRNAVCDQASGMIRCDALAIEVLHPPGNTFQAADGLPPVLDGNGNMVPQGFDPGGVNDVVVVRVAYRYRFAVPFVAPLFANNSDNGVTLISTLTMRNEPYDFTD